MTHSNNLNLFNRSRFSTIFKLNHLTSVYGGLGNNAMNNAKNNTGNNSRIKSCNQARNNDMNNAGNYSMMPCLTDESSVKKR